VVLPVLQIKDTQEVMADQVAKVVAQVAVVLVQLVAMEQVQVMEEPEEMVFLLLLQVLL
jgi:hypothetical protein